MVLEMSSPPVEQVKIVCAPDDVPPGKHLRCFFMSAISLLQHLEDLAYRVSSDG